MGAAAATRGSSGGFCGFLWNHKFKIGAALLILAALGYGGFEGALGADVQNALKEGASHVEKAYTFVEPYATELIPTWSIPVAVAGLGGLYYLKVRIFRKPKQDDQAAKVRQEKEPVVTAAPPAAALPPPAAEPEAAAAPADDAREERVEEDRTEVRRGLLSYERFGGLPTWGKNVEIDDHVIGRHAPDNKRLFGCPSADDSLNGMIRSGLSFLDFTRPLDEITLAALKDK